MIVNFEAHISLDTKTGKIIIQRYVTQKLGYDRAMTVPLRVVSIPPRKGESVHVVKDDLPVGLCNTARQLTKRLIDSLTISEDFVE